MLGLEVEVRGALGGTAPGQGFRVVVAPLGTLPAAAEGQLVVELQVAPALPLQFLKVRLIQTGPDRLLVQEV